MSVLRSMLLTSFTSWAVVGESGGANAVACFGGSCGCGHPGWLFGGTGVLVISAISGLSSLKP